MNCPSPVLVMAPVARTHDMPVFDAAREANHRIANNLSLVVAALHMQTRAIHDASGPYTADDVRAMLSESAARIDAVAKLHRALSHTPADVHEVDIASHLRIVCDALIAAFAEPGTATIEYDFASCKAAPNRATVIALIVTELVTNALKYAHPTRIPTAIKVKCRNRPSGALLVEVADDGVGLPENFNPETATSVGFQMIRALSRSLGAKVRFEDQGIGLTVRFEVPA